MSLIGILVTLNANTYSILFDSEEESYNIFVNLYFLQITVSTSLIHLALLFNALKQMKIVDTIKPFDFSPEAIITFKILFVISTSVSIIFLIVSSYHEFT